MHYIKYILILFVSIFIFDISIKAYTAYSVGQEIEYNDIKFYVIKNSSSADDTVTLLKKEPLTVDEVNLYGGVGTENNHVNMYVTSDTSAPYYQKTYDINGYGGMAYYTSETCGYVNNDLIKAGCIINYENSDIKYVVDAWKTARAPEALSARLIAIEDLEDNLGYEWDTSVVTIKRPNPTNTPSWVYNSNYSYWTMSQYEDSPFCFWFVNVNGSAFAYLDTYSSSSIVVRPVIILSKLVLGEENNLNNANKINNGDKTEMVNTPNTMKKLSIIFILIGVILVSISIVIVIRNRK